MNLYLWSLELNHPVQVACLGVYGKLPATGMISRPAERAARFLLR